MGLWAGRIADRMTHGVETLAVMEGWQSVCYRGNAGPTEFTSSEERNLLIPTPEPRSYMCLLQSAHSDHSALITLLTEHYIHSLKNQPGSAIPDSHARDFLPCAGT